MWKSTESCETRTATPSSFDVPAGQSKWVPWMDTVSPYEHDPGASFAELIIPTPDSVRYTYLLETLVLHNKHVLMTGPTGTGKTVPAPRLDVSECLPFVAGTRLHERMVSLSSSRPFGPLRGPRDAVDAMMLHAGERQPPLTRRI